MKKIVSVGVMSIALAALAATPSYADSSTADDGQQPYEPPEPNNDGWIFYQDVLPQGAEVYTVQGTGDGEEGCHFEDAGSLAPGEDARVSQEVAYNPTTCESRIATSGTPVDDTQPPETVEEEAAAPEDEQDMSSAEAGAQQTRSAGYLWSWYEDPPGIKVAEVENSTTWSWDGSNVLSSPAPIGGQATEHFSISGWTLEEQDWQNTFNSDQTTSSTYAHFRNGIFCVGITTHAHADRNSVHGQADGNLHGNWNWSKSGGCNALLSFSNQLERTQN